MRALVTGCAGFIGSTLCDRLLQEGHDVLGLDSFTDYYDPRAKRRNVEVLAQHSAFALHELDLAADDLVDAVAGRDAVFHLAGQPGVRQSWESGFAPYVTANVLATQRVLEASRCAGVERVVYASSSSVYGNADRYPCSEEDLPAPHSPYGVTKLAGEHLARLYARNFGLPTVSLRYFTVFGPRQRPEMAMSRVITAGLTGEPFPDFSPAGAVRDFTYVDDVVAATIAAGTVPDLPPGLVCNVAGGAPATMHEVISLVEQALGRPVPVTRQDQCAGDVVRTGGRTDRAADLLGWTARVGLAEGVRRQVEARTAPFLIPTQADSARSGLVREREQLGAMS